ncbi:hypothetical protein BX667DRAFT_535717 [Coemansia mojavensis]|nr:hypothetical protein BX667DRAFT_535717 [Coemansia mojavensis]
MALPKSFLDANPLETSWMSSQIPLLQSTSNSQTETLFDSQSQSFGNLDMQPLFPLPGLSLEGSRQLHHEHKAIKRAMDKSSHELAGSLSSLHEKISKVNLSVHDLHSDLKKLERDVAMNSQTQTSVVDMEVKLGNIVNNLEARFSLSIGKTISELIDTKIGGIVAELKKQGEDNTLTSLLAQFEELKQKTHSIHRDVEQLLSNAQHLLWRCAINQLIQPDCN